MNVRERRVHCIVQWLRDCKRTAGSQKEREQLDHDIASLQRHDLSEKMEAQMYKELQQKQEGRNNE